MTWPEGYVHYPQLEMSFGDLAIRPIRFADREIIRGWRNSQMKVLRQNDTITQLAQETYFQNVIRGSLIAENPEQILLSMEDQKKLVAYGGLVNISWANRRAELSFLTSGDLPIEKYESYFSTFISYIQNVSLGQFGLHKIFTETYEFRHEHIFILEKCGFKIEGRLIDHNVDSDGFCDSIIHGVILV
jgi:RimJ/RimL family protein N-acetyltransferase